MIKYYIGVAIVLILITILMITIPKRVKIVALGDKCSDKSVCRDSHVCDEYTHTCKKDRGEICNNDLDCGNDLICDGSCKEPKRSKPKVVWGSTTYYSI